MPTAPTSRRAFLRRASALPIAAALPAVLPASAAWASAAEGEPGVPLFPALDAHRRQARIAEVNVFSVPRLTLVQVVADDGTSGWGEAGHSGGELVARVVRREIASLAVGRDVFDAEPTWARVFYEIDELGPGGLASQALAGLDCALWDLRGRLLGLPVYALLGGAFRKEIPLYGSYSLGHGPGGTMTPVQAAERAALLVSEGFRAIKVRLNIREENQDPADDPAIPVVREVRRAIGDDIALYVDPNNGYSPGRAIRVGQRLFHEFGMEVYEEPVAAYHYASLARVADALPGVMIAAGEHEYTKWQFRDLILQGRVHLLNPDVSKLPGLTEGKKVAALAEVFDLPISVHNARPTLLTAAHAHYIASCQTAHRTQEHPGSVRLQEQWRYFRNRLVPENGVLRVPEAPGLGLDVDEAAVRADAR